MFNRDDTEEMLGLADKCNEIVYYLDWLLEKTEEIVAVKTCICTSSLCTAKHYFF